MIIGIDLGTTNCAAAVWRDGESVLIPNSLGHYLTPSVVGVDDDGALLIGLEARERHSTYPELTTSLFKRYMGTQRLTKLGQRQYLPEELSALMLSNLKSDAELFLGQPINEAVITVPAYFNDRQRKATKRAGELAGMKVECLVNEPTAAALAYGIHRADTESRFLVFDLGGGTFDVSIVETFEGVIEVRSSTGDNRLGGEDFNEVIVADMRAKMTAAWQGRYASGSGLAQAMRETAERMRRTLTNETAASVFIPWEQETFAYELTLERFEGLSTRLLERLREPVIRALRDGETRSNDLDEIILVGGATRMPIVRKTVTQMFGRFPNISLNPDEVVALGAGVQAGLKQRNADLREIVLTDVCPYTLGVGSAEMSERGDIRTGIFTPIIERNTVIPASRSKRFSTMVDNQKAVLFQVYQGESRRVTENILLGKIEIDVPKGKAGDISVDCRFTCDIDGLIEIDVFVPESGTRKTLVIVDQEQLSDAEIERRRKTLQSLKIPPREDHANRAALARGERCYESSLGPIRDHVGALMRRFEEILDGQDPREIERARRDLMASLDAVEGETYL